MFYIVNYTIHIDCFLKSIHQDKNLYIFPQTIIFHLHMKGITQMYMINIMIYKHYSLSLMLDKNLLGITRHMKN